MKFKSMSLMQIVRHIVQVLAFIFFPQLFITVLSSLGDLVTAVIQGSFSLEAMSSQLITVGAVLLITAVWGRFFCGFLCSFGTLQELLFFAAKKIFPRKLSVSPRTDRVLKYLKYVVFCRDCRDFRRNVSGRGNRLPRNDQCFSHRRKWCNCRYYCGVL